MDGGRIRNEKVADSKISGYVWTGPKCHQISSYHLNKVSVSPFDDKRYILMMVLLVLLMEIKKIEKT